MNLDEVWKDVEPTDDDLRETYTDAMGKERTDRVAPLPPPSLRDGGSGVTNTHRLEIHTGQFQRPRKNGESIVAEFDDDLDRPSPLLNVRAKEQLGRLVSKNRQGVQPAPDNEVQQSDRRELYDGYNVSHRLSRTVKTNTLTNRAAQETIVYGPEVHGDDHPRLHIDAPAALKAGAYYTMDHTRSQGRSSVSERPASRTDASHTVLGRGDMFRSQDPGQGKLSAVVGTSSRNALRTNQHDAPRVPIRSLVTTTDAQGASGRADVTLSATDALHNEQMPREDLIGQAPAGRADAFLGTDSIGAMPPTRKLTFLQTASVADHIMGGTDSTARRQPSFQQHSFQLSALRTSIMRALRRSENAPLPPTVPQMGEFAAGHASRARDSRNDSQRVDRLGTTDHRGMNVAGGTATFSRTGPNDAARSLHRSLGRGKLLDMIRTWKAEPTLNENGDEEVFDKTRRGTGGSTLFSALSASISKLLTHSDTTNFVQNRSRELGVVYQPVAHGSRRLVDDAISQSHTPLSGGQIVLSRTNVSEFLNDRKEVAFPTRTGTATEVAPPKPSIVHNGHRT